MKNLQSRGFTLVESLVAVTIITVAIAAPLTAANSALVAAFISRDKLTASYLAQEALEYVRAERDNAFLVNQATGWSVFLDVVSSCDAAAGDMCLVDPISANIEQCTTVVDCAVVKDSSSQYRQGDPPGTETATVFTRTVEVSIVSSTEVEVVAEVLWTYHGTLHKVTITNHLTQWQ